jgi:predicted transcriptional regulator
MNLNDKYYNVFKNELQLSDLEIKIFLLIISRGRLELQHISLELNLDSLTCQEILESLIEKNMVIEYSSNLFETFHPRFAIINRYKRMCLEKDIPWKKNSIIDNLAIMLEQPFDAARTK